MRAGVLATEAYDFGVGGGASAVGSGGKLVMDGGEVRVGFGWVVVSESTLGQWCVATSAPEVGWSGVVLEALGRSRQMEWQFGVVGADMSAGA